MKEKTQIPYYLGIDAGSSSVGWAVTDTMYHVLKTKGKPPSRPEPVNQ